MISQLCELTSLLITCAVEFMTLGGDTLALLTLPEAHIRRVADNEIAQARPLAAAV